MQYRNLVVTVRERHRGEAPPFARRLSKELVSPAAVLLCAGVAGLAVSRASLSNCSCSFAAKAMSESI